MAVNIGPKIGIDGEAQYRAQINNIIQQAKTLDSEMRAVTSAFSENTSAEEKNTATSRILAQQISVQIKEVNQLSEMLQKSAQKYGENDTRTLKWQQSVNAATQKLNQLKSQLPQASSATEKLTQTISKQEAELSSLKQEYSDAVLSYGKTSEQARGLTYQIQALSQSIDKNKSELDAAQYSTDELGDSFDSAGSQAIGFGDILKANILSQAIVEGIKTLANAIKDMAVDFIESAATVRAESSQFEQTFGEFSTQASEAIGRVADESGILDTRLNSLGAQVYAFAKASGGTSEESMALMESALRASADSAAYYDKSLEETTETLQSFLKGNYENDAALGISATETTRNAAAMKQFGKEFNDLTEIQKQQTLMQMVIDGQKLSGAFGQAARESDGWENVMGNLNESWRQFMAVVGTPVLDALIPIVQQLTSALSGLTSGLDNSSVGSLAQSLVSSFANMSEQLLPVGLNILNGLATGIMQALPFLSGVVQQILTSFTAYLSQNLPTLISSGLQFLLTFSEGLKTNVGSLVDSAIVMIQTLADGLIASLPILIENVPLIVSNIANIINENAPKLVFAAAEIIAKLVAGLIQNIPVIVANLPQIIKAIVDTITAFNWLNLGATIIKGLSGGISGMGGTVKDAVASIIDKIKASFSELPKMALQWGKDLISGIVKGITSSAGNIVNAVSGIASTITNWLHFSRPDVGPLRYYESWMPDFMQGLANGIAQNQYLVENALRNLTNGMQAVATPAMPRSTGRITVVLENVSFTGYTSQQGYAFVRDLNRQLGRLYT